MIIVKDKCTNFFNSQGQGTRDRGLDNTNEE
jgi:hypothetical protein